MGETLSLVHKEERVEKVPLNLLVVLVAALEMV